MGVKRATNLPIQEPSEAMAGGEPGSVVSGEADGAASGGVDSASAGGAGAFPF
jgi:hypothetical protein